MGLILRLIYRHIIRRKSQSILFVLGIALGVAVGVAIDLANTSANRAFSLSTENLAGRTTHQIVGGSRGFEQSVYEDLRGVAGAESAAPVLEAYVRAVDLAELPLKLTGIEQNAESAFRDYLAINSEAEITDLVKLLDAPSILLAENPVLISQSLADRHGLALGDTLAIRANTQLKSITIIGLLQPTETLDIQALDDLIITDLATAQNLLDRPDRLSRIDLILPADFDLGAIEAVLPSNVSLTTPARRAEALNQMTEAFALNLRALSLLALVVGVFLIYNTVMFSVVQRRNVLGILRSLGTSKRQIFALILGEAAILGGLGTFLGLLMGVIMAQATVGIVSQSISDLYFRVNVQSVTLSPFTLLQGALIGMGASLSAAFLPALDATRTTPAGSMRRSDLEQSAQRLIPYISALAAGLIALGILLLQIPKPPIVISFSALFLVIIGAAFFTPLGMILLTHLFSPLISRLFGLLGRMASRALLRSISRTSVAVAALTLAISVILGVGVMVGSFRVTVVEWLEVILGADIFISTPASSTDSSVNLPPELIDLIMQIEGVAEAAVVRNMTALAPDYPDLPPVRVVAVDADLSHGQRQFAWLNLPEGLGGYFEAVEAGGVIVSEPFAFHRNITPENNQIRLQTDRGIQRFEVVGVYYDYTSDQGSLYLHIDHYRRYFDDPYLSSIAVILKPDADLEGVMKELRSETLADYDLQVQSNRELRAGAMEVFDRTFSITLALQILAVIVAFIGILSALMALQLEKVREYGILRANGMTVRQLRVFTLLQTGLMGFMAGILSMPIGIALAVILIYVINVRSFGWSMGLNFPPLQFLQAFVVAIVAALLAGIYPAWRVTRIQAVEALRSE